MTSNIKCRAHYPTTDRTARIVACNLPQGHAGDHDEVIDGEAGIVTWPNIAATFPTTVATGETTPTRRPYLGHVTTRELLAEIAARIEVDGANGGGGLDYSTVRGAS